VAGELVAGLRVVFATFTKDVGAKVIGNKPSPSTLTAIVALKTTTKITLIPTAIY
jgi:hypothetical protein